MVAPDFARINGGNPPMLWWLVCIWLASGPAIPVFWLLSRAAQALTDARTAAQSPSHVQH
jgi:hypothetical protein